jgi:hypothetical protein
MGAIAPSAQIARLAPPAVTSPGPGSRRFLLGGWADLLMVGPGFTLVTSLALGALGATGHVEMATTIAFGLTLMFVGPHYAATYRRAFASRAILRAHPIVTLVVPALLLVWAAAAIRWPRPIGLAFFATYVVWSGYHYSGQSLGLAMLYPLRQGARLSPSEKRLVAFPLYLSWIVSIVGLFRAGAAARNPAYQLTRAALAGLTLPPLVRLAGVLLMIASLGSVAVLAARRRRAGIPLPGAVWAVILTQLTWFGIGLWNPFFNVVLVPIFHGAQYLSITSWHQARGRGAAFFGIYAATVLSLGLLVNPGLQALGRALAGGGPVVAAAVLSFVNLHHFLMDGRIWRLRERKVAESFAAAAAPGHAP